MATDFRSGRDFPRRARERYGGYDFAPWGIEAHTWTHTMDKHDRDEAVVANA